MNLFKRICTSRLFICRSFLSVKIDATPDALKTPNLEAAGHLNCPLPIFAHGEVSQMGSETMMLRMEGPRESSVKLMLQDFGFLPPKVGTKLHK